MWDLTKLYSASKAALHKYNSSLLTYFSESTTLNVWTEGGQWPQYHSKYDNLFSSFRQLAPKVITYVTCKNICEFYDHLVYCGVTSSVCAVRIPYQFSFKLQIIRELIKTSRDNTMVLVVQSESVAMYLRKQLADYDLNTFLDGVKSVSLVESVTILSPAMVLDHYIARNKVKYGTLMLYDADVSTVTYGLFAKIFPYITERLIYTIVMDLQVHSGCRNIAEQAVASDQESQTTLRIGYSVDDTAVSPNLVVGVPMESYAQISDTQCRILPMFTHEGRFTMLAKNATIEERTRVAYWTLANGQQLTKAVLRSREIVQDDVGLYDCLDYYASLLWAIEVVTGVIAGNNILAHTIWNSNGAYTRHIIDPISMRLSDAIISSYFRVVKEGQETNDITWKLYYYSSILHTTFTYEQLHLLHRQYRVKLRVGYVFKTGTLGVLRIMIEYPADKLPRRSSINSNNFIICKHKIVRLGVAYVGIDIRIGDVAYYKHTIKERECYSNKALASIVGLLPAQRYIELHSILLSWHRAVMYVDSLTSLSTTVDSYIENFVKRL